VKVAITGASGNVGTALLRHLAVAAPDWELVGLCRRPPNAGESAYDRVAWVRCDIAGPDSAAVMREAFTGADAVVHLAWAIQPNRDEAKTAATNIDGSRRVFRAARDAGVPHLVHASSVGAYSPGPKDGAVDESWPTEGVAGSSYSRHKAAVERELDRVEREPGGPVVTRMRPGLIFQRDAGSEVARYFLGPLVPTRLLGVRRAPVLPVPDDFVFQAVHAEDVADAYWRALVRVAPGPFNLAAPPVITPVQLAEVFHARRVRVPTTAVRRLASLTWRGHLQPTDPGWVDLAASAPVMSTQRARDELGWAPRHDARSALADVLAGMGAGAGTASAVMAPRATWWQHRASPAGRS
jgi:nucleoside-diphosphate-sugar epimerase